MSARQTATPIGRILRQFLRQREMDSRARQEQIRLSWREIVGDVIARVSSVQRIADRVVYVSCITPVWAQTLSLRRADILRKIAERVGPGAVKELRFNSLTCESSAPPYGSRSAVGRRHADAPQQSLTESQEQTIAAIAASLTEKCKAAPSPPLRARHGARGARR